jgi:hypothetical protein
MAQTRRRRRRKHRGTQGGSLGRGGGRPRSRAEARDRARSQLKSGKKAKRRQPADRRDREPTWRGAVNRALIAAGIFVVMLLLFFHQPASEAIPVSVLMLGLYIPFGYYFERFLYNRRQAQKQRSAEEGKR